jgi:3-oxo-5alpha-steroid 4-dehydrogenase
MPAKQESGPWDAEVDVVVGFGGAGVCAALEAAQQGASVLVLDRCHGGGSTAASGGVIYAGGGTPVSTGGKILKNTEMKFPTL